MMLQQTSLLDIKELIVNVKIGDTKIYDYLIEHK